MKPLSKLPLDYCPFRDWRAPADILNVSFQDRTITVVHPRSRGEHKPHTSEGAVADGSSPLPRGTHGQAIAAPHLRRFIPAPAGNTAPMRGSSPSTAVHPRSRGEHTCLDRFLPVPTGSSPLPRGTPQQKLVIGKPRRFIPALAGNTNPREHHRTRAPVHPRSRGEHRMESTSMAASIGSSPLPRGTQAIGRRSGAEPRFIPAPAGNTAAPHRF